MPSLASFLRPHPPFPIVSNRDAVQEHYVDCRRSGTSHKLAEMFALQSAPAADTDTRWLGGHDDFSVDPNTLQGSRLLGEAKAAGVSTRGKVYKGGLARYPGDPQAWVESRGDCVRRAEALGLTLEGGITYTPPETIDLSDPSKPYRVADDLLEDKWQDAVEADPGLLAKKHAKEALAATLSGQS